MNLFRWGGLAAALLLTVSTGAIAQTRPPQPRPPQPRGSQTRASKKSGTSHGWLGASVGLQTAASGFNDAFDLPLSAENEHVGISYPPGSGAAVVADGGYRVWRRLYVGAGVSAAGQKRTASVSADLPHPFFFDDFRHISGTAEARRNEVGLHGFLAAVFAPTPRVRVIAAGGPSAIRVSQALVTQVQYSESYPYDSATFTSATTTQTQEWAPGVNGRLDAFYRVAPRVGVGVLAQYTYGRAHVKAAVGGRPTMTAGGATIAAGIRFLLP